MPEYRTKTGKILTESDIESLVEEAEAGYEVSKVFMDRYRRRSYQLPITEVWADAMRWYPDLPEVDDDEEDVCADCGGLGQWHHAICPNSGGVEVTSEH